MNDSETLKNIDKKLSVIVYLMISYWDSINKGGEEKMEVILNNLGFNAAEIADLINKKPDAIRKAIQRSRK